MTQELDRSCPYCGLPLKWIPQRWFGRGAFECSRCGEFADFGSTSLGGSIDPRTMSSHLEHYTTAARLPRSDGRLCVLMIDDSNEERDLYALMLERDMTVLTASRGIEGITRAAADRPDAIVLDVMMPGMDGWEVCRQLKSNPMTAGIPVIMLTAQDEPTLSAQANRNGAAALLTKPCPVEKLTHAITSAIQQV